MTLVEVMVALFIAGLMMAGIVSGYQYCLQATMKDALYMSANAKCQERIEQTRAAQWDTSSFPVIDQLISSNFPDEVVVLDAYAQSTNTTTATLKTTISQVSTTPALRLIHVDCIWLFNGVTPVTNSIETYRAPSQ